jgi:sugar phosphate isomerase/epimerase
MTSRRAFVSLPLAAGLGAAPKDHSARLAIMCQLGGDESNARKVLEAARAAGFRRAMLNFAWDRVPPAFLKSLPGWVSSAGLSCEVLGAYVNSVSPEANLMSTRAADFERALGYAAELRCPRLVAWTGSHLSDLMKPDPRNPTPASEDSLIRFVTRHVPALERAGLKLALETYVTLTCPDAPSLKRVLDRLPPTVGAVIDPPNLTPVALYPHRDAALRDMMRLLGPRIEVVHLKDFRLKPDGLNYDLPGPLGGVMNYPLYLEELAKLPGNLPWIIEHVAPNDFRSTREKLLPLARRHAVLRP